ncbi:MAG: NAD+ synthase [Alphaproteobacteria bacterium CG_4_10_14_0_2_um_filter_63_37]|nr:MAG: hypothetical protein AUJ55_09505 [Proteobacteria bacterium CG1_02_64_396]PJA23704.1 MAG: NAD+ synthase [Alphaproteobacteria bacterium CG_4_10_14_0_2_um_filter_63_37]
MSSTPLKVRLVQSNPVVGDVAGNVASMAQAVAQARCDRVGLILFPELAVSGYPPEDLVLRGDFLALCCDGIAHLAAQIPPDMTAVVGTPWPCREGLPYNAAVVLRGGEVVDLYAKRKLPNYGVFDEARVFQPGDQPVVIEVGGWQVGVTICEDVWHNRGPALDCVRAGAQWIVNLNASPFHVDKWEERRAILEERVAETGLPILYVNPVGGQDELVFDGGSCVLGGDGTLRALAPQFAEAQLDIEIAPDGTIIPRAPLAPIPEPTDRLIEATVLGLRDYVGKTGFSKVVLGLSGGIDSAVVATLAVQALGAEQVTGLILPSPYTAAISIEDALALGSNLGIHTEIIPIEPAMATLSQSLGMLWPEPVGGTTAENIQARLRGLMVMAWSNRHSALALTTGNKSEVAVGYCTLYGDMAGAFNPIKDLWKTEVFAIAARLNHRLDGVIPKRIIIRPPSAELRPDQKDEDSLPPYAVLDPILKRYVEQDMPPEAIIAEGFDHATVHRIVRLVDINEYKRRQAAPGVKVSRRAFGRDRRYPIAQRFLGGRN